MIRLQLIVFLATILCIGNAPAVTVVDGNVFWSPQVSGGLGDYVGEISQSSTVLSGTTSVAFDFNANSLKAVQWNVDEESDWYLVPNGAPFGQSSISRGDFTPIFTLDDAYLPVAIPVGEFYMGVATSLFTFDRHIFGWGKFYNTGSAIELIESAVAYDTQGIIVGTRNTIPEPSTLLLLSLAGCIVTFKVWKNSRQRTE